jgi:hypothetical protein
MGQSTLFGKRGNKCLVRLYDNAMLKNPKFCKMAIPRGIFSSISPVIQVLHPGFFKK